MSDLLIIPDPVSRWSEIGPLMDQALEQSNGEIASIDLIDTCVFMEVVEGGMTQLVFATQIIDYPRKRVACVVALAGKNLRYLARHVREFELWCAANGATAYETMAKDPRIIKAHTRFFGMKPTYTTSWKELNIGSLLAH